MSGDVSKTNIAAFLLQKIIASQIIIPIIKKRMKTPIIFSALLLVIPTISAQDLGLKEPIISPLESINVDTGSEGMTLANAFILDSTQNTIIPEKEIEPFVHSHYPDSTIIGLFYFINQGRYFIGTGLKQPNGTIRFIYFNLDEYYNKVTRNISSPQDIELFLRIMLCHQSSQSFIHATSGARPMLD